MLEEVSFEKDDNSSIFKGAKPWKNIPKLAILTGPNGSGKSLLLECILSQTNPIVSHQLSKRTSKAAKELLYTYPNQRVIYASSDHDFVSSGRTINYQSLDSNRLIPILESIFSGEKSALKDVIDFFKLDSDFLYQLFMAINLSKSENVDLKHAFMSILKSTQKMTSVQSEFERNKSLLERLFGEDFSMSQRYNSDSSSPLASLLSIKNIHVSVIDYIKEVAYVFGNSIDRGEEIDSYKLLYNTPFTNVGPGSLLKPLPFFQLLHTDYTVRYSFLKAKLSRDSDVNKQLWKDFQEKWTSFEEFSQEKYDLEGHQHQFKGMLLDKRVKEIIGMAPHERMNEDLKNFKYQVNINGQRGNSPEIMFCHPDNDGELLEFEDLSSGEQMVFSMLTWKFYCQGLNSDGGVSYCRNKIELLLLDEPDKHLDPKMSQLFFKVLKKFTDDGVQVIMSSHRMDTISLAPENSTFTIEERGGIKCIESVHKILALSRLSRNLPTITAFQTKVFTESFGDRNFYSAVYDFLLQATDNLREKGKSFWFSREGYTKGDLKKLSDIADLSRRYTISFHSSAASNAKGGGANMVKKFVKHTGADVSRHVSHLSKKDNRHLFAAYKLGKPLGILDKDEGANANNSTKSIKVLKRHSLENFVCDPLLIAEYINDLPASSDLTLLKAELENLESGSENNLSNTLQIFFDDIRDNVFPKYLEELPKLLIAQFLSKYEVDDSKDEAAKICQENKGMYDYYKAVSKVIQRKLKEKYEGEKLGEIIKNLSKNYTGKEWKKRGDNTEMDNVLKKAKELQEVIKKSQLYKVKFFFKDKIIELQYPSWMRDGRGHDIYNLFSYLIYGELETKRLSYLTYDKLETKSLLDKVINGLLDAASPDNTTILLPMDLVEVFIELNNEVRNTVRGEIKPNREKLSWQEKMTTDATSGDENPAIIATSTTTTTTTTDGQRDSDAVDLAGDGDTDLRNSYGIDDDDIPDSLAPVDQECGGSDIDDDANEDEGTNLGHKKAPEKDVYYLNDVVYDNPALNDQSWMRLLQVAAKSYGNGCVNLLLDMSDQYKAILGAVAQNGEVWVLNLLNGKQVGATAVDTLALLPYDNQGEYLPSFQYNLFSYVVEFGFSGLLFQKELTGMNTILSKYGLEASKDLSSSYKELSRITHPDKNPSISANQDFVIFNGFKSKFEDKKEYTARKEAFTSHAADVINKVALGARIADTSVDIARSFCSNEYEINYSKVVGTALHLYGTYSGLNIYSNIIRATELSYHIYQGDAWAVAGDVVSFLAIGSLATFAPSAALFYTSLLSVYSLYELYQNVGSLYEECILLEGSHNVVGDIIAPGDY